MMLSDLVACIIAGSPHSGTTALETILCTNNNLTSAFECGILKANSSNTIKNMPPSPWLNNFRISYKINPKEISKCNSFREAYQYILDNSPAIDKSCSKLIDKAPQYLREMGTLLKNREDIPIIILKKDPKNQIKSFIFRGGYKIDRACWLYGHDNNKTLDIEKKHDNIKVVYLENILLDPLNQLNNLLDFIGEEKNTISHIDSILKTDYVEEWKQLSDEQIKYIKNNVDKRHFIL